ncbi:MAG: PEP-CTERM sorting domain-containing protein [Burkholderiaceae bacterium]|nr:PEP-CTERM sorting domain-containing protein [Burkholderiaceae bacterium]
MFKLKQMARVAALVAGMAFGMAPAMAAPTISFVSGVGGIDVVVSNLGGDIVAAYDLDVSFDTGALTFSSLTFGSGLGDEASFEVINDLQPVGGGLLDFAAVSLLSDLDLLALQGGDSVILATLQFVGTDFSSLAFVNWGTGLPTNDVKGAGNQVIIGQSQVPEPASLALVGIAMAGMLTVPMLRRRKDATKA